MAFRCRCYMCFSDILKTSNLNSSKKVYIYVNRDQSSVNSARRLYRKKHVLDNQTIHYHKFILQFKS